MTYYKATRAEAEADMERGNDGRMIDMDVRRRAYDHVWIDYERLAAPGETPDIYLPEGGGIIRVRPLPAPDHVSPDTAKEGWTWKWMGDRP